MAENETKRVKRDVSGWLILNKPLEMTSTQAVSKVRWLFSAKKAGHAGTLDPLATGVLPIALGEATKTVPFVQGGRKIYRFGVKWGFATATDDGEGDVIGTSEHRPSAEDVEAVLAGFTGTISQVPPIYSALKIDGQRAYDLARAGAEVEMVARDIHVEALTLLRHGIAHSEFEVVCGKGTYVRALARDMAKALGTLGHVQSLHRAAVGRFEDADAINLADMEAATAEARDRMLRPVAAGLTECPEIRVDQRQAGLIGLGNAVLLGGAGSPVALETCWASLKGEAIAIGLVEQGQFKPKRVIRAGH